VLRQIAALRRFEFCWLRFFYQYGPFEDPRRLIPSITLPLLRGEPVRFNAGEQVRDFLHVEDVATAVGAVALSGLQGPVNIGSGQPVTIRSVVETLAELCGGPDLVEFGAVPYRRGEPAFVCARTEKLRTGTDWRPRYELRSGLANAVAWWKHRLSIGFADIGAFIAVHSLHRLMSFGEFG
jgi:nucleoside-diphosphate-sugar epimerase